MEAEELRAKVTEFGWYHSIDLGHGVVTPGLSKNSIPESAFPDLAGRSVLDIGAWDGLYSFMAERKGASRVVALDHYVWCLDFPARQAYWAECAERGEFPDHDRDERDFWDPEGMPGRRAFDFARDVLDSKVEPVVGDLLKVDPDELGTFDVVFYLGVLYHMREPYTALEKLRQVTAEVAVIETEAIHLPDKGDEALLRFYAGNELQGDYGNWFAISEPALREMCRAAGFRRVETVHGPPAVEAPRRPSPVDIARTRGQAWRDYRAQLAEFSRIHQYRIVVHAYR